MHEHKGFKYFLNDTPNFEKGKQKGRIFMYAFENEIELRPLKAKTFAEAKKEVDKIINNLK